MKQEWVIRASKLFCVGCGILLGWGVIRWLSPLVWVLVIGLLVAAVVNPLAKRTSEKLHLPRKLCAVCYVILLLLLLGMLLYFIVLRLWRELHALGDWMEENPDWLYGQMDAFSGWLEGLSKKIPFLEGEAVGEGVRAWVGDFLNTWKSRLGEGIGALLRRTPEAILTVVVTLLCCFYLSVDGERIRGALVSLLSPATQKRWEELFLRLRQGVKRYLRAYGILMALTFFEVWIGLTILGQKYSFLLAAMVAVVDILPVLGAGTVLIPWAVFSFLFHESSLGVGLLILYGIITILRQVVEPHLVGESLGVHPLLVLLCAFGSSLLLGFGGMLLGPLFAVVIREVTASRFRDSSR